MERVPILHSLDEILKQYDINAEYASIRDDENHYIILETKGNTGSRLREKISVFYEKVSENGKTVYELLGERK